MKTRESFSPGRYMRSSLKNLIAGIREASKKANEKTESERIRDMIQYSIENDFKDGFRPREHGNDAQTIAVQRIEWVEERIELERKKQELEYLNELADLADNFRMELTARISELSGELGSGISQRQLEIARASAEVVSR
jgi:ABC-type branched-subunit amino acid transport system ATPase component